MAAAPSQWQQITQGGRPAWRRYFYERGSWTCDRVAIISESWPGATRWSIRVYTMTDGTVDELYYDLTANSLKSAKAKASKLCQ